MLSVFHKMFPGAPIYFLFAKKDLAKSFFPDADIRGSFLDNAPGFLKSRHRFFLPLCPGAVESLDLSEFDIVISSCSTFIKGIITRPKTAHVSYIHTPPRFLWDWKSEYRNGLGTVNQFFSDPLFHYVRMWDRSASSRPDYLIANSATTRMRIEKYYRRDAAVIYPPVSIANTSLISTNIPRISQISVGKEKEYIRDIGGKFVLISGDYFLVVSQLVPYKRIELAIEACNELKLPLVIIGAGPERKRLERFAGPTITFIGWQSDFVLAGYYRGARAVLFPGEDDFGIVPVEAMSYGKPVLAFRRGGATESIIDGVTGEFFNEPTTESLKTGLGKLLGNLDKYDSSVIKKRAEKFSEERFIKEMNDFVEKVI